MNIITPDKKIQIMKSEYQPINCNYYDEIVLVIMRRKKCLIHFYNEEKIEEKLKALIIDVYARDKVEYMKLEDGKEIRLDQLIALDDKKRPLDDTCEI